MAPRQSLARRAKAPRIVKAAAPRFVNSSNRVDLGEESSESEDDAPSDYEEGVVDSDTELFSDYSDDSEGRTETEDESEGRTETEDEAEARTKTEDESEGHTQTEDEADNLYDTEDEAESHPETEDEAEGREEDEARIPPNYVFCNRELQWFHPDCFSAQELKKEFPNSLRNSCHYYTTKTVQSGKPTPSGGLKTWVGYNSATKRHYVEVSEACPFRDSNAIYYDDETSGVKRLATQLKELEKKYQGL